MGAGILSHAQHNGIHNSVRQQATVEGNGQATHEQMRLQGSLNSDAWSCSAYCYATLAESFNKDHLEGHQIW
jgi:hypothetical protein